VRFGPSEEQREFANSLHDLLTDADVPAVARAAAGGDRSGGRALWKRLADVGVPALLVPQEWGGLGAGCADLVTAFEELGHHAVPGPLVESAVVAPALIAGTAAAHPDLAERFLPPLAAGTRVATVAHPLCPHVVGFDWADDVLLVRGEELRLLRAAALRPQTSLDPARQVDAVIDPGAGQTLGTDPQVAAAAATAAELGTLCVAAQLTGAARMMLAMSTEYAGQRRQFGRPVGEFQAVKHQLADVAVAVEFARPLVHGAAVALTEGSPQAVRDVSAAKAAASGAADRAARAALQVHGAVGYTREHDLSVWLLMTRALVTAWGTAGHHRTRVLRALVSAAESREAEQARGAGG
jgi:alkylation response protein AidB-like acyl-CoA dehydrogenase